MPSKPSAPVATAPPSGSPPSMGPFAASALTYPPTAVEDWLYCPMYRHLRRTWLPERIEWDPARLLGTSVGEGLSAHWRNVRSGMAVDTPEYWAGILEAATRPLRHDWQECDLTLAGAEKLVSRGLQEALAAQLDFGATILRVDESIGVCKPDLILRKPTGLELWDVKTARSLDSRYVGERLSGYDTLWQLYHGAWETEQYYGEPVKRAGILQVVLSPKATAYVHPVEMDPTHLAQWLQSAEQVWKDMGQEEHGNRPIVQRYTSCEKRRYGRARCEFHPACHTCFLDETEMAKLYQRRGQ